MIILKNAIRLEIKENTSVRIVYRWVYEVLFSSFDFAIVFLFNKVYENHNKRRGKRRFS